MATPTNVQFDAMVNILVDYWWLTLPLAILLLFGYKMAPKVIIAAFGFYIGLTVVVPLLQEFEFWQRFVAEKASLEAGLIMLVGVAVAALLYAVYTMAIAVLGFLGGGLLGLGVWYALMVMVPELFENVPISDNYIRLIFFGLFGTLGAIVAVTKKETVSSALAIVTGAGGIALLVVGLIQTKILKYKHIGMTPLYNFLTLVIFVALILLVSVIFDRKKKTTVERVRKGEA